MTETAYSYDNHGRLQNISDTSKPDRAVTFHYDERGRKSKIEISGPADYRPNTAFAGSPFEVADRAPNLPGGGTSTTIYDEHDRAAEVQVRDADGQLVSRAVRTYDAQGHIVEEKQILDHLEMMFPPETRAKIQGESGLSSDQLLQELRAQMTKLMAGQPGPYSVSYSYDAQGRLERTNRRVFNHQDEIENTYNQQGDVASEITRGTRSAVETDPPPAAGLPSYSEVHYSYKYDDRDNWIEKTISYRSSPDGTFQPSTTIKRTLTYY